MLKILVLFFVLFFIFPAPAKAEVVINEVFANPSGDSSESTEYVELFNTSETETINIDGYSLEDAAGKSFIIQNKSLNPHAFLSFSKSETSIALNNSSETISLKDTSNNVVNSFSYTETVEDKSWSRYPDGTGEFYDNTIPTKDDTNATPPSPTPTPTLTPTNSPTPKPNNTSTPTPTAKPTYTPTPKPTATKINTPTPTIIDSASNSADVLGLRNDVNTVETTPVSTASSSNKKIPLAAGAFMLGGCAFLAAAAVPVIKSRKKTLPTSQSKSYNSKDKDES